MPGIVRIIDNILYIGHGACISKIKTVALLIYIKQYRSQAEFVLKTTGQLKTVTVRWMFIYIPCQYNMLI